MKVYYIIQLNLKIKLHYFQERLSLRYDIILKLLTVSASYVSSEITNFQKDLFLMSIPEVEDSLYFTLYIIDHSVSDQLLPYLK